MTGITTPLMGVDIESEFATAPDMLLGSVVKGDDNREFMLVQMTGSAADQYDALIISEAGTAVVYNNTNSATAFGDLVGVTQIAITQNYYAWVQIRGVGQVNVAASAAANVVLNGTATDGTLDDDATAGSEDVDGIVATTADGGSGGAVPCMMNNPTVGATN